MTRLKTDRLMLRPLSADDAEAYAAMRGHPEVAKWLSPLTGDPIGRFAEGWRERGYAPWGIFLDGRLIGQGGLNFVPEFGETEVLWALHPDFQGKGYATEVGRAALAFGFGTLELKLIFAITLQDNLASQAVMKRIGLTFRKRVDYKDFSELMWFDVERDLWTKALHPGVQKSAS